MTAAPDMQATAPIGNAARPTAKVRQKAVVRFPYQCHAGITPAMNRAIERMTDNNSLMAAADIIRLALHGYLLQSDPQYRQEIGGNYNGA